MTQRAPSPSATLAMSDGSALPEPAWVRIKSGLSISANTEYPTILADQKALAVECEGAEAIAFLIGCESAAMIDGQRPFAIGYFVPDRLYDDFPVTGHPGDVKPSGLDFVNSYELHGSVPGVIHDIGSKPRILLIRGVGRTPIPVRSIYPILRVGPLTQNGIFIDAKVYHSQWSWPPMP